MNKLALANRLKEKAGIAGATLTTTIGQTGEIGHVVHWIEEAYEHIQNEFQTWSFLRNDFSFNTVAGTSEYSTATIASDAAEWQVDTFRLYLAATGVSDEQWISYVNWRDFRNSYMLGTQRTSQGKPTRHTVIRYDPQDGIRLYPVPDDIYTVVGEYYQVPDTMDLDTDSPIFTKFHMAIVWKGLELYGSYNEEPNRESKGFEQYNKMLAQMCQNYLEKVHFGNPLA